MKNMFSVGELARYQDISRQTLIFYDRIGLFKPAFTAENGYRYYSVKQVDYLDTILLLKKIGFSLDEIREHMESYRAEDSMEVLSAQIGNIERKIEELKLIKSRLEHKVIQLERVDKDISLEPFVAEQKEIYLLYAPVKPPRDRKEIAIATKKCYAEALSENLPVFFQSGISVPIEDIERGNYLNASISYLLSDRIPGRKNIRKLSKGKVAGIYHKGDYYEIASSYRKLMDYCMKNNLRIISDSYEFIINDYITSRDEDEYLTKILFYVE